MNKRTLVEKIADICLEHDDFLSAKFLANTLQKRTCNIVTSINKARHNEGFCVQERDVDGVIKYRVTDKGILKEKRKKKEIARKKTISQMLVKLYEESQDYFTLEQAVEHTGHNTHKIRRAITSAENSEYFEVETNVMDGETRYKLIELTEPKKVDKNLRWCDEKGAVVNSANRIVNLTVKDTICYYLLNRGFKGTEDIVNATGIPKPKVLIARAQMQTLPDYDVVYKLIGNKLCVKVWRFKDVYPKVRREDLWNLALFGKELAA